MNKTVGVGIIGLQGYGRSYFKTLQARTDVHLLGVCDIDALAVERCMAEFKVPRGFTDYREMLRLPELDGVFVATPHFLHHGMVMDALGAGKHVFCEKPLAISYEHAREMAQTAQMMGRVLTCHYNQRQTPYVKTMRQLVQEGVIGTVYHADLAWMARWTAFMFDARTNWRLSKKKSGGGILIGRGSHLIDAIWYILGRPKITSVWAATSSRLTGYEVDDMATVMLRLEGGASVSIRCSYVANTPEYQEKMTYEIFGDRGGIAYGQKDGEAGRVTVGGCQLPGKEWVDFGDRKETLRAEGGGPVSIIDDFIEAMVTGRSPCVTGEDAAFITRLLEAAYTSSEAGREVAV